MAQARQRGVAFAKTTRPVIGSAVRRERLFARMDGTPGRTVIWISGPPGAGKSTLAASYVEARNLACIWYQLDPDDTDVATFFHYLGHAARKLDEAGARELPAFAPQYSGDIAAFARNFFRQLFRHAKTPTVLVLDNLHEVSANSSLHAALEAGLTQVPGHCCVLIVSRTEPPPALARLRLAGGLIHLGWDDLRIGPEEIADIANLRGQSLSTDAVSKLQERTQGWAAGLVLMLEHAKVSGSIADVPGDATPKAIFDYLAGEIFERFEPKTQQFLLRIACLPRMSAEVAHALSGDERAGRLLLNLSQNDYFVREVPGEEGRFYQLHPLLRDFLRDRAAQTLPGAGSEELKRAAALLRGAGHLEDAVSLLAENREWDEIARIAAEEADIMLEQGRSETLGGWLELLPAATVDANPGLILARAASIVHASSRMARRLFAQAYDGFLRAGDTRGMIRSCCGLISATILEFDDLTALDQWIGTLAGLLTGGERGGAVDPSAVAILIRALLLRDPGNDQLSQWLDRAERVARASPDTRAASAVLAELALARASLALLRGDFTSAEAAIGALRSRAAERSVDLRIAVEIASALGHLLDGSQDAAVHSARAGLATAEAEGVRAYDEWLRALAAAAALTGGDVEGARTELQAFEAAGARLRRGDQAFIHYLRCWLAALDGDAAAAGREAKLAVAIGVELGIPWLECFARIAAAQLLAAEGDRRGAEAQVRGAESVAEMVNSPLLRVPARVVAAGVAILARDEDAALGPLRAGIALARELGLRYVAAVRPQLLAEACALAMRKGIEPEYVRTLVRARKLQPPPSALRVKEWPRPFLVTTLGGFTLLRDSSPVEFSSKGPGRPMELLKVLIALGGQNVRSEQLADALWPRVDADYAHKSFTTTLHRLRRIFDKDDALTLRETRLSLEPRLVWVDTWALEQLLNELDGALREPRARAEPVLRALTDEALKLYRGPFLPDESEQPSYIACREQIRSKLLRCLTRVARWWEDNGMPEAAIDCYQRCIDADGVCEAFYRNLMQCYQRRGERAEALATYERLRTVLSTRLKLMPSQETQAVYTSLLA
ncbi:MAG TPA: BTAD domain-containing putative transcriptional regulator [Burkholderiales bacterium]|nr:BTAD domain-containing putative transcriptional regulator [Burkholderiales bacterium]